MSERPILFSTPMVRATLADLKTETRRLEANKAAARIQVGDQLWVRESFSIVNGAVVYRANHQEAAFSGPRVDEKWRPSIHMPRKLSRITLEVTAIRVEPLQAVTEADALAEGTSEPSLRYLGYDLDQAAWSERHVFSRLWNSINGAGSWEANPDVRVISFRRRTA